MKKREERAGNVTYSARQGEEEEEEEEEEGGESERERERERERETVRRSVIRWAGRVSLDGYSRRLIKTQLSRLDKSGAA